MRVPSLVFGLLLLASCLYTPSPEADQMSFEGSGDPTSYARGFRIYNQEAYTMLEVRDPWQQSRDVIFSYILGPDPANVPDSLNQLPFIETPVKRVVAMSTTHVAMIEALDEGASIAGVSGARYIYSPSLRSAIESGIVSDVGYGQGLDFETIVRLDPDVIFLYGVEGNVMTILEKLRDLGIPAVFCGEYLETHPLGKAEWIRFFSLFYEKEVEAGQFFKKIDSLYTANKALAGTVDNKPLVLTGLPWKDSWYIAGGASFAARLIEDAGGQYLWADHPSSQAVPMDLESVYSRAVNANIWINPGAASSLQDLRGFDQRFEELEVLQHGRVFNNNARVNPSGGNDYWESGAVRPDLVLKDLITVFHPDLLTDHRFIYYRQLK